MRKKNYQLKHDRYYGVKADTYAMMLSAMWRDYRRCRKSKGRNYNFGPERRLELFLRRLYHGDTFDRLAFDFGISKSSAHRIFWRIVDILQAIKAFNLIPPSKLKPGVYTVDGTIIKIQRSSDWKKQKAHYSGKHHTHCAKVQIIAPKGTICPHSVTFTRYGSTHDMALFKRMYGKLPAGVILDGDSGYQGIDKLIPDSLTPYKKPKGGELTEEQKDFNKAFARTRIKIEHCNSYIKRFDIIGGVYYGAIAGLERVIKLICGICKFELTDDFSVIIIRICGTTLIDLSIQADTIFCRAVNRLTGSQREG